MHVLGIDAGGTKTVCLLADGQGGILAQARGPGANLQAAGELDVEKVLHGVMEEALGGRRERPKAICLGIAGVDREDDARTVQAIMRRISTGSAVIVVNDALVALVAGVGTAPGVVVVAGTGSIAYGCNADGVAARAGGWGHVIGDEGSGYWIGRRALAAVVREVDGRGPRTQLTGDVLEHFGVRDAAGLIHIVYNRDVPRANVARLGPIVQAARDHGDAVAADILDRAADELVLAVTSVVSRLEMRGASFPCVLAGGMFTVVPSLVGAVQTRLQEVAPRAEVRRLDVEPAVGAVRLAVEAARGTLRVPPYIHIRQA